LSGARQAARRPHVLADQNAALVPHGAPVSILAASQTKLEHSMTIRLAFAGVMAGLLLAGCGTTPQQGSATATAPAAPATSTAPAALPAQAVRVPAESKKKVVLNMSGAKTSVEAKDWASFKEEWRATFAEHAKDAGIAFAMQEGEARPGGEAGTLLNVYVNDYRQVGIGARIFLGVMTGNAFIDAKVSFSDLNNGTRFGEQVHNTSSSAWSGVFAKVTPQQVDAIATDVFREIKTR
jgi:uncharacterized lipoprotein YmbA